MDFGSSKRTYNNDTFSNKTVESKNLVGYDFNECKFNHCTFISSVFEKCNFEKCEFDSCTLSAVKFRDCLLKGLDFFRSKVIGIDWTECKSHMGLDLSFEECDISYSVFSFLNIAGIKIQNCSAKQVGFDESNLQGANMKGSDFLESNFTGANLQKADFTRAVNYRINPMNAKIKGAKFSSPEVTNLLNPFGIVINGEHR